MDENAQKEQFSNAYLQAITSVAGFNLAKPNVDNDSVDWQIGARGGRGTVRSPKLELQLKCTSQDVLNDEHIAFPLKRKNYDDLRHKDFQVPRILVVVIVPVDIADWVTHSESELVIRYCGYWRSIRGFAPTENDTTVTIELRRSQLFDVDNLNDMMHRIEQGGLP